MLAGLLGACGPGGDSDEDKIREVVEKVAENNPEVCKELTDQFLSREFDGNEKKCEQQAEDADEDQNLEIQEVEVEGDKATVQVTADGDKATARLVKEDGDWKLDAFQRGSGTSAARAPSSSPCASAAAAGRSTRVAY